MMCSAAHQTLHGCEQTKQAKEWESVRARKEKGRESAKERIEQNNNSKYFHFPYISGIYALYSARALHITKYTHTTHIYVHNILSTICGSV